MNNNSKFHCETCKFTCSKSSIFEKHLKTKKHLLNLNPNEKINSIMSSQLRCDLCKFTCYKQNIFEKHLLTCKQEYHSNDDTNSINVDNNVLLSLVEQIKVLTNENRDLTNTIIDISKTPKSVTNNNANSHKTFNMNFFLNETCKDAMNIDDFVSSVQPTIEELEETGKVGYVAGITNVILKRLNKLELNMKPMHCSDAKREILYIKDKDVWEKESTDKPLLSGAIKMVAHKNMKNINEWKNLYPDCNDAHSRKNNAYLHIVSNSMAGGTSEEIHKNMSKIVSNIVKEVVIDK